MIHALVITEIDGTKKFQGTWLSEHSSNGLTVAADNPVDVLDAMMDALEAHDVRLAGLAVIDNEVDP